MKYKTLVLAHDDNTVAQVVKKHVEEGWSLLTVLHLGSNIFVTLVK